MSHPGDNEASRNGQRSVSTPQQGLGRRESVVSDTSANERASAAARIQQRKILMAQQMSLGLDAEIKAQDQAQVPKRRSIFRTGGTASTPDLGTLIRGKKTKPEQKPMPPKPMGQAPSAASSSTAVGGHLGTAMSGSTSSLTGRGRGANSNTRGGAEWDRANTSNHSQQTLGHHFPNESQRHMGTINEGPADQSQPSRQSSVDEGGKAKRKPMGKGMFGRMFGSGSGSSGKEHGPLTSSSQISLSGRSQADVSSPQSQTSPQLAASPSPRFASPAQQFPYENGNGSRPPIPQRPSVPIVPKAEHDGPNFARPSSERAPREIMAEPQQMGHHRQGSVASTTGSIPEQPIAHVVRDEGTVRGPSRKTTAEEQRERGDRDPRERDPRDPRDPRARGGSSFSDDVTGLLDRIGDRIGHDQVRAGMVHDGDATEHLQVSPERPSSGGSRYPRSAYSDKSRVTRSPSMHDEPVMAEALPVPVSAPAGVPPPFAAVPTAPHPPAPIEPSPPSHPLGPTEDQEAAVDDASETDVPLPVPAPSPGLRVPSPSQKEDWMPPTPTRPVPELPPKRSSRSEREKPTPDIPSEAEPVAIEVVTTSPGQSTTNLNDMEDDEEQGRVLALEFLENDTTHVPADKVAMFIGGPRPVNNAALRYYMQYFDMRGLKLDQAFRDLCAKLHLKAESQEIDRIIEGFSARYYDCNPNTVFGTPGVVHTVTGAMLMLNTDLHIAELQKHMSRQDFVRNAMRAIQESMPDREGTPDVDSGSLRNLDSAAQSTTSVRLRQPQPGVSRSASGTLGSPGSELSSPSTQDLRSRASSVTINSSFTYTKAWEAEAENALKEIFANVRSERILLPTGGLMDERQSTTSLGAFSRRGAALKRGSKQSNSPYSGSGMFAHSDGRLSPTPSYPNSIGETLAPVQAIGFASNLSHTVIKEHDDETHSVRSNRTASTIEEMNDDELALLGAPWAKEGLLQRKIQVEAHGKKPQKKDWKQYFVVIQKGDLHMFVFGAGGSSSSGGPMGGGNWMASANRTSEYSVMHAMAMALPKPGYSASRPYCFTVTFPTGEISVFQAGTEELVAEWVATCNYWAARKSRQPLPGGVSNMEYGWTRVLDEDGDERQSMRSARTAPTTRMGAINRVRTATFSDNKSGNMDKIHINEWKPPPHATMPSNLDEEAQLESLGAYVQRLKEELDQHKSIEEPMGRLYSSGSKNFSKARENWTAKSRYIHSEIFKYETYVEALRNAITLRVQRQGEKKVEKSLRHAAYQARQHDVPSNAIGIATSPAGPATGPAAVASPATPPRPRHRTSRPVDEDDAPAAARSPQRPESLTRQVDEMDDLHMVPPSATSQKRAVSAQVKAMAVENGVE